MLTGKERYQAGKDAARQDAIEWQAQFAEHDHSWQELADAGAHFEALAKRYGLTREFRENGII